MMPVFRLLFVLLTLLPAIASFAEIKPGRQPEQALTQLKQSRQDTTRLRILQELSHYYTFKPGNHTWDIDSALTLADQAEKLSETLADNAGQAKSWILFSQAYREKGEEAKGKNYIEKALLQLSALKAYNLLGEAYLEKGDYYGTDNLPGKLEQMEKALFCFKQGGNKEREADVYLAMGDLHEIAGRPAYSMVEGKKALQLYQAVGHKDLRATYTLLGMAATSLGDFEQAVKYGLQGIKIAESMGDSSDMMCTIYNRVGITYFYMMEYESSLPYYRKAMKIARRLNDERTIHSLTVNITNALLKLNRPQEALVLQKDIEQKYPPRDTYGQITTTSDLMLTYAMLDQPVKAEAYCKRLEELLKKRKNLTWEEQRLVYGTIIKYFLSAKQYGKMRQYLIVFEKENRKAGGVRDMMAIERSWFTLDSTEGNLHSAIGHYQRFKQLSDSLFNDTKSKQIAQLQIQYETEKKDRDLKLQSKNIQLLTEEGQLKQSKLEQATLLRNITFVCVALLLVIVALLYNRYMYKQRNNKKLETQQEEISRKNQSLQHLLNEKDALLTEKEWLLKEIHHRVKNNLQIVMSLLNTQSAYLNDPAALDAIRESQNRVHSMSLIHQKLYQSENVDAINMVSYIYDLTGYLRDTFNTGSRIRFNLSIDPLKLEVSQAVPIGLILNEAITNAIKYAFPDNRDGIITLSVEQQDEASLCKLTISDNGIGLPENFNMHKAGSLGMSLIQGLTVDIEGELKIEGNNGTTITIIFEPVHTTMQDLTLTTTIV